MSTSTTAAPAGWYPDPMALPASPPVLRWWDGVRWAGWVAVDGAVSASPIREPGRHPGEPDDERMVLGGPALGLTIAAVVWSIALTIGTAVVAAVVGLDTDAQLLAAGALGLYAGLVLGCVVVHRRFGTPGRFRQDYGFTYTRGDWWRGLVASLAARGGGMVLAVILAIVLGDLIDADEIDQLPTDGDPTAAFLLTFAVVALVLAPIVEELFFRGLLLRALEGVVPDWLALAIQGVLFGLAHISFGFGLGNLLVVVPIGFGGVAFGWLAQRYRRLGPGILGHAWFNLVAVLVTVIVVAVD
jgi:membrane protease YdiL (CAAX protease family)